MNELTLLMLSAASLGFVHTVLGPDHYLPFIALSKARQWSQPKTMWITFISGIGHVGSSVLLGMWGVALGVSLNKLEAIEARRGEIVAWLLIFFGVAYSIYGIYKFFKNGGHAHLPAFLKPKSIRDIHHLGEGDVDGKNKNITGWMIFLIFVFGPCEVLIPMLIFPAAEHNIMGAAMVALIFGIATISTMMLIVLLGYKGTNILRNRNTEKYIHLAAGLIILTSGLGMVFLGW